MKTYSLVDKIKNKLSKDANLKELLSGSAVTFVLKMSGMGLGYVLIYLISQKLGAEAVGFYQVMVKVLTVLGMIFGLGMNISVLRYVGQFNNKEQRPKMHLLYSHFIKIVGPLTIVVSVILYFSAGYIIALLDKEALYAEGLRMVAIVLPFFTINQISVEFIRGLKKLKISELVRSVLRPLVMVAGISIFFSNDLTKMDVIYLLVVGLIINSIISRWAIWTALKEVPKTQVLFKRKEFLKTSTPMMLTGISSTLMAALPIFFLDFYASQEDVGIFAVAFRLASLVSLVLVVVNTIAAPKFAELYWADKKDELQKFINQSVKIMFWIAFSLTVIIIAWGNFLLGLFGDEYTAGYWVLVILVLGQLLNAATGSVGVFMNMSGKQKELRKIIVILTILGLVSYIFIGVITTMGYIIVALISVSINMSLNIYLAYKVFKESKIKTFYLPLT